jgi:hypothetical protein
MTERQLPADAGDNVPGLPERNEDQRPDRGGDDVIIDKRNERQDRDDGDGQEKVDAGTRSVVVADAAVARKDASMGASVITPTSRRKVPSVETR